jgi:hypothetical protein
VTRPSGASFGIPTVQPAFSPTRALPQLWNPGRSASIDQGEALARLRRENDDLRKLVKIYAESIRQLTLDNEDLYTRVKANAGVIAPASRAWRHSITWEWYSRSRRRIAPLKAGVSHQTVSKGNRESRVVPTKLYWGVL